MREHSQPSQKTLPTEYPLTLSAMSYAYNRNAALDPCSAEFTAHERTVLLAEVEGSFANIKDSDEHNPENTYSPAGNGLTVLASTDGVNEIEAAGSVRYTTGIMGNYGHAPGCAYLPLFAPQSPTRHRGGSVYLMADGHAKFLRPELVSPGDNATAATDGQNCVRHAAAGGAYTGSFAATFSTR